MPSHAAAIAATPPSTWPSQHSPAVWRSTRSVTDHPSASASVGSGPLVEDHVGRDPQRDVERVARPAIAVEEIGQFEHRTEMIAAGHRPVLRRLLGAEPRRPRRSLPHRDEPEPDGFDAVLARSTPSTRRTRVASWSGGSVWRSQLAAWALGSSTSRSSTRASQPVSVEPAVQPVAPVLPAHVRPRRQQLAVSAVGEVVRCRSDELPAQLVDGQLAVAEEVAARRGDDERRVGDDQVEALALDRVEQVCRRGRRRW